MQDLITSLGDVSILLIWKVIECGRVLFRKNSELSEGSGERLFVSIGGPESFIPQYKGDVYVEFKVPTNSLMQGGRPERRTIIGAKANYSQLCTLRKQGGKLLNEIEVKNLTPILKTKK